MRTVLSLAAAAGLLLSVGSAGAVTEEDFTLQTAQDLVDVCSVETDSPMYMASLHFCHGFLVGTGHYHRSMTSGPSIDPLFCLPNPPPSRSQAVDLFLAWADGRDLTSEAPVDALIRFAQDEWPCS